VRDDPPRLGPWLRRYDRQEATSPRERMREFVVAGGAAAGILVVLAGVLLAFVRFPFPTLRVLVAVWGVGYVIYRVKRGRADLRERLMRADLEREGRPR